MIVGSLLLIVVAVGLLVLGLVQGSNPYLVGSIVASLLAAVTLIAGSRQAARDQALDGDDEASESDLAEPGRTGTTKIQVARPREAAAAPTGSEPGGTDQERRSQRPGVMAVASPAISADDVAAAGAPPAPAAIETAIPVQNAARDVDRVRGAGEAAAGAAEDDVDEDPPDEPATQSVSAADTARLAVLDVEVYVVDGRPRYHLASCGHLSGRDGEALSVAEAVELGFTPCARCEPGSTLLAEAHPA